jgi:hypothetical protein
MSEKPMSEKPMDENLTTMDCAAFEKMAHHLYRPAPAEVSLCEAALAHAEACSRCAALLTEVEWLEFSMRDLARHDANRRVSPRVESALLQEFRRRKAAVSRRQLRRRLAALGAAAAFFLFLGLSWRMHVWRLPPLTNVPVTNGTSAHSQPAVAPASAPVRAKATSAPAAPARQSAADEPGESEYADSFVPLPYADESAVDDGGTVVRVLLSRPALASFGLPVDDFASGDQIQADLLVAADGTPEAIRLVSQLNPREDF